MAKGGSGRERVILEGGVPSSDHPTERLQVPPEMSEGSGHLQPGRPGAEADRRKIRRHLVSVPFPGGEGRALRICLLGEHQLRPAGAPWTYSASSGTRCAATQRVGSGVMSYSFADMVGGTPTEFTADDARSRGRGSHPAPARMAPAPRRDKVAMISLGFVIFLCLVASSHRC